MTMSNPLFVNPLSSGAHPECSFGVKLNNIQT